jgi:ubiquinone/menaquinone biosynthesis C-methylase UbiE
LKLNLRALQKHWNSLGNQDPLRAILARSEKKDVPWDVQKFFETGVSEIDEMLRYLESVHAPPGKKWALDFGCGVGRLTQALAKHFEQVCGVDISPAMIEHARSYQAHGANCQYLLNETSDLRCFPDGRFDFIYSSITLQHMPARFARRYIVEFLRVLQPAGLLLFQIPSHRQGKLARIRTLAHDVVDPLLHPFVPRVVMRGIPREEVIRLLREAGVEILDIAPDESAGPTWQSFRYLVKRPQPVPSP